MIRRLTASRSLRVSIGLLALAAFSQAAPLAANDWIVRPSRYTHDPVSGYRVNRFAPEPVVYHTPDPSRSVYSHSRSTLQVGDTASNYHRVTQYGAPIRPYGEWRFPYRPFSTPYPNWGPQPWGAPGWGAPGWGWGGGGFGGIGSPFGPNGVVNGSGFPWNDGWYPDRRSKPFDGVPFGAP